MEPKKKNFSSFNQNQAFKQLQIYELNRWEINAPSILPSDFFQKRLARLDRFDLNVSEKSKELLIDAICEEGLEGFSHLKIWKGANLDSDQLTGVTDYLVAPKRAYLEAPMLCIIEAKKDDFAQGLAQCLVQMQACQWQNLQLGMDIDIFGIVSNGGTWIFYKLTAVNEVWETLPHSIGNLSAILTILHYIFH